MKKDDLINVASLRVCIGYLGEKDQYAWWESSFYSKNSKTFLTPIYNKTAFLVRYHSVREAALKVHDKYIGIGTNVFHLFRLPEFLEKELHDVVRDSNFQNVLNNTIENIEKAKQILNEFSIETKIISEGPIQVGSKDQIEDLVFWGKIAYCYNHALQTNKKIFPYFLEQS